MTVINKHPYFEKGIQFIGDIFGPVVNILCAVGLLKGGLTICITLHWLTVQNPTYQVLWLLSNVFFNFLPIFLAFTSAKVLQTNRFTAVLLAAFLVQPQLAAMLKRGTTFLGLKLPNTSYDSTVLPIIFAVILLHFVERGLKKVLPKLIQAMFVPLISLLIVLPITLFILGPVGNLVAKGVTLGYNNTMAVSPVIAMALLAGLFPVFIMLEISTALAPVAINNIAVKGDDTILISLGVSLFALAGMALAVYVQAKAEPQLRVAALSGVVTALLGVGEPSVFGIGLDHRRQFVGSMLAAAVGGLIVGAFRTKVTAFIIPSVVTIPAYIGQPGYLGLMIGAPVAFMISFAVNSWAGRPKLSVSF
ncbi:hypothetical protein D1831_00290 [Lactiplantibacillus garii]|uniref:PTS EIIC type-1 domain-containing protein n=1 Tax=Lactiplantibacillus garii TaxID=2306423 RepID=A0A3R8LM97_9LACO|nr:PTS transporter subunit EIIC [Lactiplantibacillus garii]RRK11813.1 hypothetical protein D1831_00290 [Lactiplantibacillus garii]